MKTIKITKTSGRSFKFTALTDFDRYPVQKSLQFSRHCPAPIWRLADARMVKFEESGRLLNSDEIDNPYKREYHPVYGKCQNCTR